MAPRGRPRVPREVKVIRGTFRKDRNPEHEMEPSKVPEVPKPPSYLGKYAKKLWKQLAPELYDAGILTVVDLPALEMCCDAYGQFRELRDAIHRPLDPDTGKKGKRTLAEYMLGQNSQTMPEYTNMKSAFQTFKSYLTEFGFTPASRNRIEIPEPKKPEEDPMGKLLDG